MRYGSWRADACLVQLWARDAGTMPGSGNTECLWWPTNLPFGRRADGMAVVERDSYRSLVCRGARVVRMPGQQSIRLCWNVDRSAMDRRSTRVFASTMRSKSGAASCYGDLGYRYSRMFARARKEGLGGFCLCQLSYETWLVDGWETRFWWLHTSLASSPPSPQHESPSLKYSNNTPTVPVLRLVSPRPSTSSP